MNCYLSFAHVNSVRCSPTALPSAMCSLPGSLVAALDGWGPRMREKAQGQRDICLADLARRDVTIHAKQPPLSAPIFRIGTDCSGAGAPIWACRQIGLQHTHAFSSDIWPAARAFEAANCPPRGPAYTDMCGRCGGVPPHDIYVCGFPCQPFSTLHNGRRFFAEKKAKPFRHAMSTVQLARPALVVLENVVGILQASGPLFRALREIPDYDWFLLHSDPRLLGEPVRRPRVYILGVRGGCGWFPNREHALRMVHAVLHTIQMPVVVTAVDRLLPNSHPHVRQHLLEKRTGRRFPQLKSVGQAKWVRLHTKLRNLLLQRVAKVPRSSFGRNEAACPLAPTGSSAELLGITNPRKVDMWSLLCHQYGRALFAADLSQNVGRARVSTRGELPTITPRSDIAVAPLGRRLIPIEHLLANGFPLHKMRLPSTGCSNADLAKLGGNTMHVQSVGSVMLIGLCLLDLTRPLGTGSVPRARSTGGPISVVGTKMARKQGPRRATARGREKKRAGSHRKDEGMGSTKRLRELFVVGSQ